MPGRSLSSGGSLRSRTRIRRSTRASCCRPWCSACTSSSTGGMLLAEHGHHGDHGDRGPVCRAPAERGSPSRWSGSVHPPPSPPPPTSAPPPVPWPPSSSSRRCLPGVADFVSERAETAISSGGAGRTDIWAVGLEIVGSAPVSGVGLRQLPGRLHAGGRPSGGDHTSDTGAGRAPHNIVLSTLAELGPVGLVLLALFLGPLLLRRGWGPRRGRRPGGARVTRSCRRSSSTSSTIASRSGSSSGIAAGPPLPRPGRGAASTSDPPAAWPSSRGSGVGPTAEARRDRRRRSTQPPRRSVTGGAVWITSTATRGTSSRSAGSSSGPRPGPFVDSACRSRRQPDPVGARGRCSLLRPRWRIYAETPRSAADSGDRRRPAPLPERPGAGQHRPAGSRDRVGRVWRARAPGPERESSTATTRSRGWPPGGSLDGRGYRSS